MKNDIKIQFANWWNSLHKVDVIAINTLASNEAWYQFDFGRHYYHHGDKNIILEKSKVDVTIGEVQIEFKTIWNNKNIWATTDKAVADAVRIRKEAHYGYIAFIIGFFNRRHFDKKPEAERLPSSYGWNCKRIPIQPGSKDVNFIRFCNNLWYKVAKRFQQGVKLADSRPKIMIKYASQELWCGATLWKVK